MPASWAGTLGGIRVALAALGLLVLCVGCAGATVDSAYLRYAQMEYVGTAPGQLGIGDRFELRVYREPDMSGVHVVDESGTIAFPLIGPVDVVGRTCSEIADEITARLAADYLRDPAVTCQVIELNSLRVVVGGEVRTPGRFAFTPNLTIMEAIALAEGFTSNASEERVVVTRIIDGESTEITVPLKLIVSGRAPNFRLWPGDIVTVPPFRLLP